MELHPTGKSSSRLLVSTFVSAIFYKRKVNGKNCNLYSYSRVKGIDPYPYSQQHRFYLLTFTGLGGLSCRVTIRPIPVTSRPLVIMTFSGCVCCICFQNWGGKRQEMSQWTWLGGRMLSSLLTSYHSSVLITPPMMVAHILACLSLDNWVASKTCSCRQGKHLALSSLGFLLCLRIKWK